MGHQKVNPTSPLSSKNASGSVTSKYTSWSRNR